MKKTAKTHWWKWEIYSKQKWLKLGLRDLYYNRGLITRFARRDLLANHQQTIFGPLWLLLQPLISTLIYVIIFDEIVKISTGGLPPVLFYLTGVIIWTYFSDCLVGCMYTFRANEHIFAKVYFPRLVVPLSVVLTQSVRLGIQLLLLFGLYLYYYLNNQVGNIGIEFLYLPLIFALTAGFATGLGLVISIFTVRYRDLDSFLNFGLRILMFLTPVFYPSSMIPEKYKFWVWLNPLVVIIRTFRQVFSEVRSIDYQYLIGSSVLIAILLFISVLLFKRQEIKVMDVI